MSQCVGNRAIDGGYEYCQLSQNHAGGCLFPGDPAMDIEMLIERIQTLEHAVTDLQRLAPDG